MVQSQRTLAYILTAIVFIAGVAFSQTTPRVTISGRVLDDSTLAPLQSVDVFIAHTTLGCGTDQYGQFEIHNIPVGSYEIVASRLGYLVRSFKVTLSDSGRKEFEIRLRPTVVQLGEVIVPGHDPAAWRIQLEKFTQLFLGSAQNAKQCRIVNPEVLEFKRNQKGTFYASASRPIIIDNFALGYRLEFHLTLFRVQGTSALTTVRPPNMRKNDTITVEGLTKYTELKGLTAEEKERWKQNRVRAFKGSLRHFLISLVKKNAQEEGFNIYQLPYVTTKAWDSSREIVEEEDILFSGRKPYEKIVRFKGVLEVEYTKEAAEEGYDLLIKENAEGRVSWLCLTYNDITVDTRGFIREWFPTKLYGYWAWQGMADELPWDYEPTEEGRL